MELCRPLCRRVVRRIRRSERFYSQGKDVADAPFGLDHARRTRIGLQFAPQAQDLDVDAAIEDVFVHAGGLQQMLPREGTLRRFQERKQQAVFPFGQGNRIPAGSNRLRLRRSSRQPSNRYPPRSGSWARAAVPSRVAAKPRGRGQATP